MNIFSHILNNGVMAHDVGEFFYFGICHFCKNESENVKRCASCKTVAYCSKEHQKSDWNNHKQICKTIASSKRKKIEKFSFEDWKDYRVSLQKAWTSVLNRELKPYECQMWMFPRACNVCYSTENLTDCAKCKNVTYCSHEHQEQDESNHELYCKELKLCMDIDRYLADDNGYPRIELKEKVFSDTEIFPEDIEKLLNLIEKEKIYNEQILKRVLKADSVAPGAIILYALKISGVTQSLQDKLILHVIGSSSAEGTTDWQIVSELIFHWIQKLNEITYIFIGPEAWDISTYRFNLCQTCRDNKKNLKVKVYKQLYHEVIDNVENPNLVMSFNSGLHEYEGQNCDQWQRSIPVLIRNSRVPFVFTSYTEEEMLRDLQRIRDNFDTSIQILMCGKNPYASPRPIRDWCTENIPVFYSSSYISIIRKQQRTNSPI